MRCFSIKLIRTPPFTFFYIYLLWNSNAFNHWVISLISPSILPMDRTQLNYRPWSMLTISVCWIGTISSWSNRKECRTTSLFTTIGDLPSRYYLSEYLVSHKLLLLKNLVIIVLDECDRNWLALRTCKSSIFNVLAKMVRFKRNFVRSNQNMRLASLPD